MCGAAVFCGEEGGEGLNYLILYCYLNYKIGMFTHGMI